MWVREDQALLILLETLNLVPPLWKTIWQCVPNRSALVCLPKGTYEGVDSSVLRYPKLQTARVSLAVKWLKCAFFTWRRTMQWREWPSKCPQAWFERTEPGTKEDRFSRKPDSTLAEALSQVFRPALNDLKCNTFPLAPLLISFLVTFERMLARAFRLIFPGLVIC